jgi:LPS export ABC transporter protein LptC
MRDPRFRLLWVLVAAIGGAQIVGAAAADGSPGLRITGMTFVGSRGAESELVVRATTALFHPDSNLADLDDVRATVSDETKGESFAMSCDTAALNVETNDFTATGNVRGVTGDGQRYQAPWVRYDHASSLLLSDAPVTVVGATGTLQGDGFRYHIDERRFELLGNVTVVQEP